jgi:acetylornithine deacetylase
MISPPRIDAHRLQGLARRLIDEYSPSGKEHEVVEVAEATLTEAGLAVERLPVADERDDLVILPPDGEAEVVLVGHLDTVPAYDIEDFAFRQEEGTIYGLGAADMKGGCAAMMEAFIAWRESTDAPLPAALALVVGEEESGDGAEALLDEHRFGWALIGEPTNLDPCLGCWSYLELSLEALGRRSHAAVVNPSNNAIQTLLRRLLRATEFLESHPSRPAYNLRDLSSAVGGFAVPAYCETSIDVHLSPETPLGEFVTALEEALLGDLDEAARQRLTLDFETIDAGFQLPERGLLIEQLRKVLEARGRGFHPRSFRSHSDANRFWAAGVRPLVMGPGRLRWAHCSEEHVRFDQMAEAAQIYLDLLQSLSEG